MSMEIDNHFQDEETWQKLHGRAEKMFQSWKDKASTLQATAVMNEAWLRLNRTYGSRPMSRAEFFKLACAAMRHQLADHVKKKFQTRSAEAKESGVSDRERLAERYKAREIEIQKHKQLSEPVEQLIADEEVYLLFHEDMERLTDEAPAYAEVLDQLYQGGATFEQIGQNLGVSASTAHNRSVKGLVMLRSFRPE